MLPPEDFDAIKQHLADEFGMDATMEQILSYAMYPKVYDDYRTELKNNCNFRYMGSDIFFHGLEVGETSEIQLAEGKIIVVKLVEVKSPDEEGFREVVFEVNGNRRTVRIMDKAVNTVKVATSKLIADVENPGEIGANIPGNLVKLLVKEGDTVVENQPIAVLEAMKMETNVICPIAGTVKKIHVKEGDQVIAGELIAEVRCDTCEE